MWFEQIIRHETGCATYMLGSSETRECMIFDPLWDIEPYLQMAKAKGTTIRYVMDSHSHADHVSGARRLAAETGAELLMPEGAELTYSATKVSDGQMLTMGEVRIRALSVPGHRPEQIALLISDLSRGDEPWFILAADSLYVGDVARPDLAQSGVEGARTLFTETLPMLGNLPPHIEVFPGHVAGST